MGKSFEDELDELILRHKNLGLGVEAIQSALELAKYALDDDGD